MGHYPDVNDKVSIGSLSAKLTEVIKWKDNVRNSFFPLPRSKILRCTFHSTITQKGSIGVATM